MDILYQEFEKQSYSLRVEGYQGANWVMDIETYNPIKNAKVRKKPNKLIIFLEKEKDWSWSSLKAI